MEKIKKTKAAPEPEFTSWWAVLIFTVGGVITLGCNFVVAAGYYGLQPFYSWMEEGGILSFCVFSGTWVFPLLLLMAWTDAIREKQTLFPKGLGAFLWIVSVLPMFLFTFIVAGWIVSGEADATLATLRSPGIRMGPASRWGAFYFLFR